MENQLFILEKLQISINQKKEQFHIKTAEQLRI